MERKTPEQWATIEHDYREGDMSLRDLGAWHHISEATIRKRAKAGGWARNEAAPKAPIKRREIAVTYRAPLTIATQEAADPAAIAERGFGLVVRMMDELEATSSRMGELEAFIAEATNGDESSKRTEALMRAVSLPSRAGVLKALALAAKTLLEARAEAPKGKKQAAQDAAGTAGHGSEWGNDLTGHVN